MRAQNVSLAVHCYSTDQKGFLQPTEAFLAYIRRALVGRAHLVLVLVLVA